MPVELAGRQCRSGRILKGVGQFQAQYQVGGYNRRQHLQTIREWYYYNFAAKSFHTEKLGSKLYRQKLSFFPKQQTRFLRHSSGNLMVTYASNLKLVRKPVVDFLFAMIERFRQLVRQRHQKRKSVKVGAFRRGVGHFQRNFRWKGALCTNHCWCQTTRGSGLLYVGWLVAWHNARTSVLAGELSMLHARPSADR